ncbi:DUF6705 family protein [Flavobacterium sp.]|uniref:DUF6705 family protein n=1 Tax=Flavobacterium sp. TaxID=239 RepID=UPI003BD0E87C
MKNTFKILILILFCSNSFSQTIKPLSSFQNSTTYFTEDIHPVYYYKDISNYFTPFLGQWKYVNGNKTFILTLWKETKYPFYHNPDNLQYYSDVIFGHYKLIQDYGLATEQLLYTSETTIGTTSQSWETILVSDSTTPNEMSGIISDIHATPLNPANYPKGLKGFFNLTINSGTSSVTANMRITSDIGLRSTDQPFQFTIPTNVVLTKM